MQNAKWREKYLMPFNGLDKADAITVWGTWFFPFNKGGLTKRWQKGITGQTVPTLSDLDWKKIKSLTKSQIDELSPCEKADMYFGNKDFRITKHEMFWRGTLRGTQETEGLISSTLQNEGFCNGARAAGALTPEPVKEIVLKYLIDDSLEITFKPLDIKMLATMSYFHIDASKYQMIGGVKDSIDHTVNAAVFDIALRSVIGAQGTAFFMDLDPNPGVSTNVTIIGYDRTKEYVPMTEHDKTRYPMHL